MAAKTRDNGKLTEAEYFSKIRSALRKAFQFWNVGQEVLKENSRPSQSDNKRLKTEYQCNRCKNWFSRKLVNIDHIIECGSLRTYDDIVPFLKRLTPETKSSYQILCCECHKKKTKECKTAI